MRTKDKLLYSPIAMNKCMNAELVKRGWHEDRTSYRVTGDVSARRAERHLV